MRKCRGEYVRFNNEENVYETVEFEEGMFHQWGTESEELENGVGSYMVGIVELPDGKVIMPVASDIRFID